MRYISTRGQAPAVSFLDAALAGMAPDGGLYVPESWPEAFEGDVERANCASMTFNVAASYVIEALGVGDDAARLAGDAYLGSPKLGFPFPMHVAPLVQVGPGEWMLELFHGPSLSFKDIAMQLIGHLYDHALSARGERRTVVCATSGDTGGAAVEALKNRERVDLFVLTPKGRVSEVQRRFMTASGAENVHTIDIDGDFDACQAIVKTMFADHRFAGQAQLSGVNSINWARIAAQSTYFHVASQILCAHGPVNFVVPTGNFGDAYSGWVAKQMGAPVGRIVLATNANDILSRALNTGRYERGAHSYATLSPAMDIQVASNFERILFEALDRDADHLRGLYAQFAQSGGFDIPPTALAGLRENFAAASVSNEETEQGMQTAYFETGYLACPHTAVGLEAKWKLDPPLDDRPVVTLATAHPAKFPETVEAATGVKPPLPAHCADLFSRAERIDALPNDAEAVKRFIRERSRAWS
ncbi:MAG: threonine synthase [Hyphomonadaceae bacterium JAD_PAG50586_4]|nr:MAG: threonine synthase [Hyphomonadaceae bacterium JAD_PAG50586_4]